MDPLDGPLEFQLKTLMTIDSLWTETSISKKWILSFFDLYHFYLNQSRLISIVFRAAACLQTVSTNGVYIPSVTCQSTESEKQGQHHLPNRTVALLLRQIKLFGRVPNFWIFSKHFFTFRLTNFRSSSGSFVIIRHNSNVRCKFWRELYNCENCIKKFRLTFRLTYLE